MTGLGPPGGTMNRTSQRMLLLALPLALAATACGGGGDSADPTTTTAAAAVPTKPSTTEAPATTAAPVTTEAPVAGITGYGDVQPAVVQIVAQGTFRDPEVGFADGSGLGSGFIISPDGLAVTNNHVVA